MDSVCLFVEDIVGFVTVPCWFNWNFSWLVLWVVFRFAYLSSLVTVRAFWLCLNNYRSSHDWITLSRGTYHVWLILPWNRYWLYDWVLPWNWNRIYDRFEWFPFGKWCLVTIYVIFLNANWVINFQLAKEEWVMLAQFSA